MPQRHQREFTDLQYPSLISGVSVYSMLNVSPRLLNTWPMASNSIFV
jgi:hypothetical protein